MKREKFFQKRTERVLLILLLIIAVLVGFELGSYMTARHMTTGFLNFVEGADITIDFNETAMVNAMFDKIKDDPRFNGPAPQMVDVRSLQDSRLPKPEEPDVPELI